MSLEVDDSLSKLANKAKRKLSKTADNEMLNQNRADVYVFQKANVEEEQTQLKKKIAQLLKSNPDCENPIGKLIDHRVYDKLGEEQKQNYVLKLAENYRNICESLK